MGKHKDTFHNLLYIPGEQPDESIQSWLQLQFDKRSFHIQMLYIPSVCNDQTMINWIINNCIIPPSDPRNKNVLCQNQSSIVESISRPSPACFTINTLWIAASRDWQNIDGLLLCVELITPPNLGSVITAGLFLTEERQSKHI